MVGGQVEAMELTGKGGGGVAPAASARGWPPGTWVALFTGHAFAAKLETSPSLLTQVSAQPPLASPNLSFLCLRSGPAVFLSASGLQGVK